jgi:hypothetical protein
LIGDRIAAAFCAPTDASFSSDAVLFRCQIRPAPELFLGFGGYILLV